jgi:alpha-ketoglutaric semialdehyde dehydrogenase
MTINGNILIGASEVIGRERPLRATNPNTGQEMEPDFAYAGAEDVERAAALAEIAFNSYRAVPLETRAAFLETIAQNIVNLGDELITRANAETGLSRARIETERARTVNQLKLFASVVRKGEWLDVRIDPAMPERKPFPRPDLRLRQIGLGPVAVFGASNFPLAFSVAGGDTAAALAAGCPVIVKGHPAHPGTGELVGRAIQAAVKTHGLHEGVFSLLLGAIETGTALVTHEAIKAVGFTGSRGGGLALVKAASERTEPIPVYAEMSSVNPVFVLPAALDARAEAIAEGFVASLTQDAGQYCTNPGIVVALEGPGLDRFLATANTALAKVDPTAMLTPGIFAAFERGVKTFSEQPGVTIAARGAEADGVNRDAAALFLTDAKSFLADPALANEIFGAAGIVIACHDLDAVAEVANALEGQLTATLQIDAGDYPLARQLMPVLERKVGRILANQWPTGVEVAHAMVHGGPFPATSDSRSTSVGTLSIRRFLRPVSYQNLPPELLPAELATDNPLVITRLYDGARQV